MHRPLVASSLWEASEARNKADKWEEVASWRRGTFVVHCLGYETVS